MNGNFKKGGWKGNNTKKNSKEVTINFFLINEEKVGIQIPYGYCVQTIKNDIMRIGQGIWSSEDKCWVINREGYKSIFQKVQDHFWKVNNQKDTNQKMVKVNEIEEFVFRAQQLLKQQLSQLKITNLKPYNNTNLKYNSVQTYIDPESLPFYNRMFDFQKQSLKFGIQHHGRMLLADEMGVGKTIQSLAVAYIYKHEWPLLIICPPTLRINWQNQIKRWYPDINPQQIQLINSGRATLKSHIRIMIISYDLAWRMTDMFQNIKVVIADQAHYLKGQDSKRSKSLVPYLSTRRRVILLTGTPAFARPRQIYNLIEIVRPDLFKNFKLFGNRYCDPQWNHWSKKYEYDGCKNQKQLYYILKNNIMIRRLKSEVLKQLPDKNRQKVVLETDSSIVKDIKQVLEKNNINKMQTFFSEFMNKSNQHEDQGTDKRQQIMQAYRLSGIAKIKAIKQYINQILENNIKILVFAHHMKVMDEIESELKNKKHKFMRIDGSVSQNQRAQNVENFQNDPEILVALLSITAAGVGITLTAASTVIFAELHWTPALMIQAQDRAHRVGQKDSVNCHYLIGQNTLDEMLYKFLERKVLNVTSFVDGQSKDLQFEELKKGEKGKFSKKEQTFTSSEALKKPRPFGSGMMLQLPSSTNKKNQIHEDQNSITSQMSQMTDISNSSSSVKKPSRKKTPSTTLDTFVVKKSLRLPVNEMSELKYMESDQSFYEDKYEVRKTVEFNDFYWEAEEKKEEQYKKSQKKSKSSSNKTQIDSDEQFQKVLDIHLKSKASSKKNSQEEKQFDLDRTQTKQIEIYEDNISDRSSTRTLSNKSVRDDEDVQI